LTKATAGSVSAVLESKGASCREAHAGTVVCHQGADPSIDLTLLAAPLQSEKLEGFYATTQSAQAGGQAIVEHYLRSWLPTILSALLPDEPRIQQAISGRIPKKLSMCSTGEISTMGYRTACRAPAMKDDFGRPSTSWSTNFSIYPDY
jgi:hypothetical protein